MTMAMIPTVMRKMTMTKPVDTSNPDELTKARGAVYGPPIVQFRVAQQLKANMNFALKDNFEKGPLKDIHIEGNEYDLVKEALDMIAVKLSRICTGDPTYLDNWDDIAGYAACVTKYFRGKANENPPLDVFAKPRK